MQIKTQKNIKNETGLLVIPFFKEYLSGKTPVEYTTELNSFVKKFKKEKEFEGKKSENAIFTVDSKHLPEKLVFVGCGKKDKFSAGHSRDLGAEICSLAKDNKQTKIIVLLIPELNLYVQELVEGIALKNYRVSKYKTGTELKKEEKKDVKEIALVTVTAKESKVKESALKALILAQAANITKDLVNGPANIVDADYFERIAKHLASDYGYKLRVFNKQKLESLGWGGLLAVGQGSTKPAKCIILEYRGGGSLPPIVLIGKGIVFDTGGYNLKPTKHIEDMHCDKAGASAIIGIFSVLKELKIKQNIIGILPLAENMIDGKALRPSDIITMLNGKTVEITNTDAEGRVILADALTHGCSYKPRYMIDIATLTGSVMAALGDRYSGVLGNSGGPNSLIKKIVQAGEETDELMWELPIHEDHRKKLKSKVADLVNCDEGTAHLAGASKGAAFLENFVDEKACKSWAHVDIAGTAFTKDPKKSEQAGATGVGVRTILKLLENI